MVIPFIEKKELCVWEWILGEHNPVHVHSNFLDVCVDTGYRLKDLSRATFSISPRMVRIQESW